MKIPANEIMIISSYGHSARSLIEFIQEHKGRTLKAYPFTGSVDEFPKLTEDMDAAVAFYHKHFRIVLWRDHFDDEDGQRHYYESVRLVTNKETTDKKILRPLKNLFEFGPYAGVPNHAYSLHLKAGYHYGE